MTVPPDAPEIVLFAKDAEAAGSWTLVSDDTAAYGLKIAEPDAGAAKVTTAAAGPVNYFELSFAAKAKVPYHLWIGSTQAMAVVLEDCSGCGVHGWGWQDNGYGTGVLGPQLFFTDGPQTIRIQQREEALRSATDGIDSRCHPSRHRAS